MVPFWSEPFIYTITDTNLRKMRLLCSREEERVSLSDYQGCA